MEGANMASDCGSCSPSSCSPSSCSSSSCSLSSSYAQSSHAWARSSYAPSSCSPSSFYAQSSYACARSFYASSSYAPSDTEFSSSTPIKARSSNASRNYYSAVQLYTYFERDKEETWFSPIREGLYNVDKNYASARGRQPYMEKDECETLTPATLQSGTGVNDITIAIMGVTGSGKSSFIDTITKADAEASDLLDLDNGHGRTAPQYAPETWPPSFVSFSRPADNFGTDCRHIMCFDCATNGEDDLRNDRMSRYRCPDEDNMSSVSSSDQESLFEYSPSPSESDTTTTVSSSAFQQELTHTNIEHMLAVLKAERGKCLRELRGFDAALETIDQLVNRKCPEPKECSHGVQGP